MKLSLLLASLAFSAAAFAKPLPVRLGDRAPRVPVSHMTCAQAHAFAMKHGFYYVESADGLLPIYPIEPTAAGTFCGNGSKVTVHPDAVRTLDSGACILSWYCI